MDSRDYFGLAVRIIGLLTVSYGLHTLVDGGLFKLGYFTFPESTAAYYLIVGLAELLAGIYLLSGAPAVVAFAYRGEEPSDEELTEAEDDQEGIK